MKKKRVIRKVKTKRIISLLFSFFLFYIGVTTYLISYSEFVTNVSRERSGVVENIVYVNDAESDYYYYMSKNFTYSDNRTLPTTLDKQIYSSNNLVELTITYSGKDNVNSTLVGYVSPNELQDTYVYYKVLPVNDNGTSNKDDDYVLLELIDNPFAYRPGNYGFNGWVTNYQNAFIYVDTTLYIRYAKVPVTYDGEKPNVININFYAKWVESKVINMSSYGSWQNAFNALDADGFVPIGYVRPIYEDLTGYYIIHYYNTGYNGVYPEGALDEDLNDMSGRRCRYYCQFYTLSGSEYDPEASGYYEYVNGNMQWHNVVQLGTEENPGVPQDSNIAGYYKKKTVNYNESFENLYNSNGELINSGRCTNYNGCEYYELQQYYKEDGSLNITDGTYGLNYKVTRDTNVIVYDDDVTGTWGSSQNKKVTVSGIKNGNITDNYININSNGYNLYAYNDTRVEYVEIYTATGLSTSDPSTSGWNIRRFIFANFNNLKIGRGIRASDQNYVNAVGVIGGNTSTSNIGQANNPYKYRVIVESGIYNNISVTQGLIGSGNSKPTIYVEGQLIAGNDYDRVKENNENLEVYENLNGTFGGKYVEGSSKNFLFDITLKSGRVGTSKSKYSTGIYVGGRGYSSDTITGSMNLKVEGGWAYNIIGGPLVSDSLRSQNVVNISMTGGEVESIYGGAGDAATYGNRIISIVGGTVNYSVFGGSNGYQSDEGKGTLNGTPYIYIGGNAKIGDSNHISNEDKMFGAESGSVFGIGNGKTGSSTIGSCDNSNIIINDKAKILNNVYGGGNYGATGVNSSSNTTSTTIKMFNGEVSGSIYGGGNNNGSGSSSKTSTINITMEKGTVTGNIYGGSKALGRVYGSTNVLVSGGTVNNVYGGGEGGYTNNTAYGTFVTGNVNVTIGDTNKDTIPTVKTVYGGSAFGTVNGSSNTTNVQSSTTSVTVNKGNITSVFGGGQGNDTYTPYVEGNVTVTVNGGTITNVYGGNDAKGTPNGTINVNINNGTITNTFGGGNLAPINTSSVYLNGGTATNVYGGGNYANATTTNVYLRGSTTTSIYGGSNQSGDVTTSNITTTSGSATTVYGGNNLGGVTTTSNITVNGGNLTTVFGGGNEATTGTTNIHLNASTINSVYGGGNKAGVTNSTNVTLNGSTVTNIFGGSNQSGDVLETNITIANGSSTNVYGGNNEGGNVTTSNITTTGGSATTVYGGNNLGGVTTTSNITVNGGNLTTVFGGGNEATTGTTNIHLNASTINSVYGGGNKAGVTNSTNVTLNGSTVTNIFGGSNQSGDVLETNITIANGSSTNVYGGNNEGGNVTTSNITTTGGSATTVYGGNNLGGVTTTSNITVNGGNLTTVFGGGNEATTGTTNIHLNASTINSVYGGGNKAGVTNSTNVTLNGSTVTNIFGGSNQSGDVLETNITIANGSSTNVYGGNNEGGNVTTSNITTTGGSATTVYGGNNLGGETTTANITANGGSITEIFGGGNKADTTDTIVKINGLTGTTTNVYGGGNEASVDNASITIKNGVNITNLYGGSNSSGTVTKSEISIPFSSNSPTITNIYGGNNRGGKTISANIDINCGQIGNVYGGGNYAETGDTNTSIKGANISGIVVGGGNQAAIENSTVLKLINTRVTDNVYGGGNLGTVGKNTEVFVSNSILNKSLFAGGNGATAIVYGNTSLDIEGSTRVANHVFGGGNAAATGTEANNNSTSEVNIAGLICGGNVYGGANTSVLYGTTNVNIGKYAVTNDKLTYNDIIIDGTVFGGGEANASGSEIYDFSFISVTTGIDINIDANGHDNFEIKGSIFGSGNASSTSGYSNVTIKNYGTEANPKKNISLQRASKVTLDNSTIVLKGTTDRTNEYSDVLFSLSRLDELALTNNSVIYLENSTNLVKSFKSLVSSTGEEVKESITISDTGNVTSNVNNKIFIYEGRNINIATNENITAYGRVTGMAFFGMFSYDREGNVETGYFKTNYNNNSTIPSQELVYFTKGSYVLGLHHTNHNYEEDGFYSNFPDKTATDKLKVDYIVPTPEDSNYYMWVIGEQVASYEISLTASKYSTLGTYELPLINFSSPNTTFSVLGFNYNDLNSEVQLVEKNDIPRIAESGSDADNIMGLVMQSSDNGWITNGRTTFLTNEALHSGTINYISENSSSVPTFLFYLYHSKNLETKGEMGSATISMVAITPIDDLNNEVKRINIIVNLSRALFTTDDYEGTITSGKKYEMFAPGVVNITRDSSFTTYYSLFIQKDETIYKNGYHRVLSSTFNFPENTKITMIDLLSGTTPEYYYYVVTNDDYINKQQELVEKGDVSYALSKFVRMGSSNNNNHYDDVAKNDLYYNEDLDVAEEEFIFIVDFKGTNITENVLGKTLLLELRSSEDEIILSVIGVEQQQLFYNLYADKDTVIEVTGDMSTNEVYIGEQVSLNVNTNNVQQSVDTNPVVDTNFNNYKPGIKISIIDSRGEVVNGPSIMGISYTLGTETYYPRFDGTVRINVAERIANVSSHIIINTEGSNLASGNYKMLIESFASPDGIYYGLDSLDHVEIPFEVKNTLYGLKVSITDDQLIVKKETGLNETGTNAISANLEYSSGLLNPNIRISLYRRDYDEVYSTIYRQVDFKSFFSNEFSATSKENKYMLFETPESIMSTILYLKDNLTSGTYRLQFELYDRDTFIGEVHKYVIIK